MQLPQDSTQVLSEPENGARFGIQVTHILKHESDIIKETLPFKDVTDSIEGIANAVIETLKRVQPHKASVEFGIEIAVDEGKLLAVVVKGEATANMKITLEWEKDEINNINSKIS